MPYKKHSATMVIRDISEIVLSGIPAVPVSQKKLLRTFTSYFTLLKQT